MVFFLGCWSWSSWTAIADLEREVEKLKNELEQPWRENLWFANTMHELVDKNLENKPYLLQFDDDDPRFARR